MSDRIINYIKFNIEGCDEYISYVIILQNEQYDTFVDYNGTLHRTLESINYGKIDNGEHFSLCSQFYKPGYVGLDYINGEFKLSGARIDLGFADGSDDLIFSTESLEEIQEYEDIDPNQYRHLEVEKIKITEELYPIIKRIGEERNKRFSDPNFDYDTYLENSTEELLKKMKNNQK